MGYYNYKISSRTKAILSYDSAYYRTRIFEGAEMESVIQGPKSILNESCIAYGASLQGRLDYVKKMTNLIYKLPVPISPGSNIIFFPTASVRDKGCIWLAFNNIKAFYTQGSYQYVEFVDHTGIHLNISQNILTNQYMRTAQLATMMKHMRD